MKPPKIYEKKWNLFLLIASYPVEMRVERVLASVLFTALWAYHHCVLIPKMNILYVPFQGHLVKI